LPENIEHLQFMLGEGTQIYLRAFGNTNLLKDKVDNSKELPYPEKALEHDSPSGIFELVFDLRSLL
jgi:hypothetical protein